MYRCIDVYSVDAGCCCTLFHHGEVVRRERERERERERDDDDDGIMRWRENIYIYICIIIQKCCEDIK